MTSKYKIPSKGDLIQCPYDDTHMIRVEKFQYHLIKCRKWHPCTELMVCPFNARHESRKEEMRYHITNCPDRVILDQDIKAASREGNKSEYSFKGNTSVPDYNHNIPDPEEMWSDDDLVYEDDPEYNKRRSWSINPSQGSETKSEGSVITPARRPATNVDEKTKPIYSYSLGLAEKGKVPANQRQASSSMLMSGPCSSYRNLGSQNFSDTCSNTSFASSMSGFSSKEEFHAGRLKTLGIGRGRGPAITKLAFKGEEERDVGRPSNAQTPSNAGNDDLEDTESEQTDKGSDTPTIGTERSETPDYQYVDMPNLGLSYTV